MLWDTSSGAREERALLIWLVSRLDCIVVEIARADARVPQRHDQQHDRRRLRQEHVGRSVGSACAGVPNDAGMRSRGLAFGARSGTNITLVKQPMFDP